MCSRQGAPERYNLESRKGLKPLATALVEGVSDVLRKLLEPLQVTKPVGSEAQGRRASMLGGQIGAGHSNGIPCVRRCSKASL